MGKVLVDAIPPSEMPDAPQNQQEKTNQASI